MITPAIFDLYFLLVETIFGSIWLAGLAVAAVMVIVAVFMKMSPLLQMFLIGQFVIAFCTGYFGVFGLIMGFIFSFLIFAGALIRFIMSKGGYS